MSDMQSKGLNMKLSKADYQQILKAYIACALRSTTADSDDGTFLDQNFEADDLGADAAIKALDDIKNFMRFCGKKTIAAYLEVSTLEQLGHDFWLTRNGHGAGFWDRGHGEIGETLTNAAHSFGGADLYAGDDGLLYFLG